MGVEVRKVVMVMRTGVGERWGRTAASRASSVTMRTSAFRPSDIGASGANM